MRVCLAAVCALAAGACGGQAPGAGAIHGPARAATAGRGETCDRDAIVEAIDGARLRARLGRLGDARFELAGTAIRGDGGAIEDTVPVLAQDGDRLRIAVRGQRVTLLVWVDRADLAPVTLVEHRVSYAPGRAPPPDGLGLTVYPGHPVDADGEDGWVRVHGHGLFAFDGWIPDDRGDVWEPVPPPSIAGGEVWIERGSSIIDDPDGKGHVLASVRRSIKAHLLESNALAADKVELVDADARLVGYAVRPPPMRRIGTPEGGGLAFDERPEPVRFRDCLYSEPGGAVIGLYDGPLPAVDAADQDGWGVTPVTTAWGDVVLSVRLRRTR
jgi:hypothetical protein